VTVSRAVQACAVLLLVIVLAPRAVQSQVSVHAHVDSTDYVVGDPITVKLEVHHPEGTRLLGAVFDTTGGFILLDQHPLATPGATMTRGEYVVARYDSVQTYIPPITVSYILPGDTTHRAATSHAIAIAVRTVSVDTSQAIKDLRPPLSIPLSLREIVLYAGALVLLAGLVWLAIWWWRRRKRATGEAYTPPARPAHVVAMEELALLKEKKLWQQGLLKEYYSELTEILRRYIENRYSQPALEETTDEIIIGLRKLRFPVELLNEIEEMLRSADLVKFAKQRPGINEHENAMALVYDIIDRTKIVPMTPVPVQEGKEGVHAGA
jgi:hypothetical protein